MLLKLKLPRSVASRHPSTRARARACTRAHARLNNCRHSKTIVNHPDEDAIISATHSDHLGTPRKITGTDNNTAWQLPYSTFGENSPTGILTVTSNAELALTNDAATATRLATSSPLLTYNLRFPGQYFDTESKLNYNHFRSYQSERGGYTQPDPIGLAGGLNRFGYALQNPLMYTDADGLSPLKIIALCAKGYRVIKKVGLKEAIQAARCGENVMANSHAEAKQIARAASNGKKPIRDPAHKPDEGQRPHYHANPRNGGHIFYSLAAAVTVSHYLQCEDKDNPCVEGVLGQVADFFNPLSAGQDIVDIFGGAPE
jgi:RHS repeat-associated protein